MEREGESACVSEAEEKMRWRKWRLKDMEEERWRGGQGRVQRDGEVERDGWEGGSQRDGWRRMRNSTKRETRMEETEASKNKRGQRMRGKVVVDRSPIRTQPGEISIPSWKICMASRSGESYLLGCT